MERLRSEDASGFKKDWDIMKPMPCHLLDVLPLELLMAILCFSRPRDLITLCRVNKTLRALISDQEKYIANKVIQYRYPNLAKCFPRPVLLKEIPVGATVPSSDEIMLCKLDYTQLLHTPKPDPALVCSCEICSRD